jgi:hypothetical protein
MTTLAALLYRDDRTAQEDLEEALHNHELMKAALTWPGALPQIAEAILAFLEMPISNLAVSAYQKHRLIEAARRETARSPGTPQVVQLMEHTIRSKLEPTVDIEVNGVTKTLLRLELVTEISVEAVTAVVQSGQVVDIAPGSATAKLTLSAAGVELAKAETQPVDLAVPKEATIVIDLTAMGEPIIHPAPAAG